MADGTTYYVRVVVRDNAGNEGKSAADNGGTSAITPSANTAPYNLTTSAPTGSRTTTSLTITASATDNEQTTLYYDLYWNGSSTVTETKQGTRGSTVTFTARTGLSQSTSYSWKIVVRDGNDMEAKNTDTISAAYTNCIGYSSYCTQGSSKICNYCAGLKRLKGQNGSSNWARPIVCNIEAPFNDTVSTSSSALCAVSGCNKRATREYSVNFRQRSVSSASDYTIETMYYKLCETHFATYTPPANGWDALVSWRPDLFTLCNKCDAYGYIRTYCIHGYSSVHYTPCIHGNTTSHTVD